ncbi:hypothetical protein DOT_4843 [Desulfosporosinus sp. OT]|nr:hypothetical protein DOT_4843 [Desulfosporosinus sp. OT]
MISAPSVWNFHLVNLIILPDPLLIPPDTIPEYKYVRAKVPVDIFLVYMEAARVDIRP